MADNFSQDYRYHRRGIASCNLSLVKPVTYWSRLTQEYLVRPLPENILEGSCLETKTNAYQDAYFKPEK